jgi:hypothetical protein
MCPTSVDPTWMNNSDHRPKRERPLVREPWPWLQLGLRTHSSTVLITYFCVLNVTSSLFREAFPQIACISSSHSPNVYTNSKYM